MLRAGFSVVEPGAWLRPHFGTTNAQLKLHLGLRIPGGNGTDRCATLRVDEHTRGWAKGEITMFDDSFEHEVHNHCDPSFGERVVFQLVIAHPDLPVSVTTRAAAALGGDAPRAARHGGDEL